MGGALDWTIEEPDGCAVVTLRGDLGVAAVPRLRTVLLKCLAEQPAALLVDLAALTAGDDRALTVFPAVVRQAATWPGTPVVLCAVPDDLAVPLRHSSASLDIRGSVAAALREVLAGRVVPLSISDRLLPVKGAVHHARDLVAEACGRWGLPELIGPAALVASELVTNAVEHAGTMIDLRLVRTRRYLHVVVRDGSAVPPVKRDGGEVHGLRLVEAFAVRWGHLPARDGKVVWATLSPASVVE
jgi:anti-anti-sigma regulatory factor